MLRDWNRKKITPIKEVFHFAHSLRPFILSSDTSNNTLFIDIEEGIAYTFDELESQELDFYRLEEDEDFLGLEINGTIEQWFNH